METVLADLESHSKYTILQQTYSIKLFVNYSTKVRKEDFISNAE